MQVFVHVYCFAQTGRDKDRERELLSGPGLLFAYVLAGPGHVHLYQTMNDVLSMCTTHRVDDQMPHPWKGYNLVFSGCLVRHCNLLMTVGMSL
jgi:hypothetical protein